jgi:large subunit ribosomal protein L20
MSRARKGAARRRKHKRVLREASGYWGGRHRLYQVAKVAIMRAQRYAYRDRRTRKRDFRRLWVTRLTAACRARGLTYSRFIHGLNLAQVEVDRKAMSELAIHDPVAFDALVQVAREALLAQVAGVPAEGVAATV